MRYRPVHDIRRADRVVRGRRSGRPLAAFVLGVVLGLFVGLLLGSL